MIRVIQSLYRTQVIPHLDRLWLVEQLVRVGDTRPRPLDKNNDVIPHTLVRFLSHILQSCKTLETLVSLPPSCVVQEKSGVTFGTLPPTWARRVATLVLTLFPFLYLAVLWKVIHRMYNPRYSSFVKSEGSYCQTAHRTLRSMSQHPYTRSA